MRKLGSIQKITAKIPIEGADLIELVEINNWHIVVTKADNFLVNEEVIFFEIDSFLPIRPEFEFLRKNCYKKMANDLEGFRLRTLKLRGQYSQGLVVHKHLFPECKNASLGEDVTDVLGVQKYEPPMPSNLEGIAMGSFPSFIRKTDEERIQNLSFAQLKKQPYYVTEKVDGSSVTFYVNDSEFGVCSRNLNLKETENNTFWKIARKFNVEEILKIQPKNLALQGEVYGEGIQGNKYKKLGTTIGFFSLFDIDTYQYCSFEEFKTFCSTYNLPMVPIISENFTLPQTVEEIIIYANGKSILNPQSKREGVVIRLLDSSESFKVISNEFLLKFDD